MRISIIGQRSKALARTLIEVDLHIVFSTKHRANIVHPEIEPDLHRYIGGIIANFAVTAPRTTITRSSRWERQWRQVSPATHVVFGTEDATAPRSVRNGRRFRGSREGS